MADIIDQIRDALEGSIVRVSHLLEDAAACMTLCQHEDNRTLRVRD